MTDTPLTADEIEALRQITSPTVCNAIETLDLRPRSEGFMGPEINCLFPDLDPLVAYACTAIISARMPPSPKPRARVTELWEHVAATPGPKVLVIQDMDYPNPIGSFWGEVNGNIFKALGCRGHHHQTAACATSPRWRTCPSTPSPPASSSPTPTIT